MILVTGNEQLHPNRQRVLDAAKQVYKDQQLKMGGKTYRSTLPVTFTVVDSQLDGAGALVSALAVLAPIPSNALNFFSYGIAEQIPDGLGGQVKATNTDTNQAKGGKTNGGEIVGIESIALSCVGMRVQYGDFPVTVPPTAIVGAATALALSGQAELRDPGSLYTPPQYDSPDNLENPWLDTWASSTTFTPQFDTNSLSPLGALDEAGEGGARSFLKAHGEPHTSNRYKLTDSLLWMPDGKPGSDFALVATPTHQLAMVLTNPATLPTTPARITVFPKFIVMDIAIKAGCFIVSAINPNQGG